MSVYLPKLAFEPIVHCVAGAAVCCAVGYAVAYLSDSQRRCSTIAKGKALINLDVKKDQPKVVDTVDVEDLGNKEVFCRCWKSKKFPYCDGAHAKHNKECDDNVGPLIIQKRDIQPSDK